MSRKKKLAAVLMAVLAVAIVIGLLNWRSTPSGDVKVRLFFKTTQPEMVELYWSTLDKYSKDWSSATAYPNIDAEVGEVAEVSAQIRTDKTFLRVDLGSQQMVWTITGVVFESGDAREELSDEVLLHPLRTQDVESISKANAGIEVAAKAGDPQLIYKVDYAGIKAALYKANEASDIRMRFFALGAFLIVCGLFVIFRRKLLAMPMEIIKNRGLVLKLAKNDFKTKYAGSYLGIVWAFVQPVVTVLVYWLVFSIGFRSSYGPMPFVMYLVCGIVPWFFIQDFLNSGTNALIEYSYLVKKVVFNISVLPMVKAVSAWFVHVFFVIL
ncbi:MAG: ABC transporter permease, partial [Lachnospiraceae bacterium]